MAKQPVFEIFSGKDRQHYWRLKAPNGEIIATSEGYSSKQMCEHGIESVRQNALLAETKVIDPGPSEAIINPPEVLDLPKTSKPYMGPLPNIFSDDE